MAKPIVFAAFIALFALNAQAQMSTFDQNVQAGLDSEFNIANGLAPVLKDQKISLLEPFSGEFRILGSKQYHDDEQAKYSPIDYAVTRGLFTDPEIARQISINQYDRYLNWKMAKTSDSTEIGYAVSQ